VAVGYSQHCVRFVECDQAVDVTGIEALDDETAQFLRLRCAFAFCLIIHDASLAPKSDSSAFRARASNCSIGSAAG